jgi:hypothetical protein
MRGGCLLENKMLSGRRRIFILDSPGLPIVYGRFGPKAKKEFHILNKKLKFKKFICINKEGPH